MAGHRLTQRVEALEGNGGGSGFTGYACIFVHEGETIEQAQAAWVQENGPVGSRQWVLWNFGGLDDRQEAACPA